MKELRDLKDLTIHDVQPIQQHPGWLVVFVAHTKPDAKTTLRGSTFFASAPLQLSLRPSPRLAPGLQPSRNPAAAVSTLLLKLPLCHPLAHVRPLILPQTPISLKPKSSTLCGVACAGRKLVPKGEASEGGLSMERLRYRRR